MKKRFIEGLAQDDEGATAKGDMKQLYDTSKTLIGSQEQGGKFIYELG